MRFGLAWSYLAGSAASVGESLARALVIGAIAGALMGASVSVVTAQALRRMRAVCVVRVLGVPQLRQDRARPI